MSKGLFLWIKTTSKLPLKVNKAKRMSLLSRNLKLQNPIEKLTPYKFPVLCKAEPFLYQNYANWNTGSKTVFKSTYFWKIVSLLKNSKKLPPKCTQSQRNAFIVYKFENKEPDKQTNSIQISCIVQDATKFFSKLRKFKYWKKNCFQTYLCLKNCFFVKKLQEIFF